MSFASKLSDHLDVLHKFITTCLERRMSLGPLVQRLRGLEFRKDLNKVLCSPKNVLVMTHISKALTDFADTSPVLLRHITQYF